MIDLVELPYRQYGTATSFDTTLPVYSQHGYPRCYGRVIELYPFISGSMHKYKLIEQVGDKVYERIFLASTLIDSGEWWQNENTVYPIQLKVISHDNAIVGYSHKYVAGICHYLADRQSDGTIYTPTIVASTMRANPAILETASRIIPSHDTVTISHDLSQLRKPPIDPWLHDDLYVSQLYHRLHRGEIGCAGLVSLGDVTAYQNAVNCYDTDPIDHSWCMYDLIALLSDLVVSDLEIVIQNNKSSVDIRYSSRYNINIQQDTLIEYAQTLIESACSMALRDRRSMFHWNKIVITKTWAEEVYIDIYETQSPGVISNVLYVDLPIFALGTVGLTPVKP